MACVISKSSVAAGSVASSGLVDTVSLTNVMSGRADLKLDMHGAAAAAPNKPLHLKAKSEAAIGRAKTIEPPTPHQGKRFERSSVDAAVVLWGT